MIELTPAGRAWAERQPTDKRIPNIALHGAETGWPEAFIVCAIKIANEQAEKETAITRVTSIRADGTVYHHQPR